MDLFTYDFMVRALLGALIIGVTAPALGVYLVQRRLSLIGDGIGHVALTGVGVGLLFYGGIAGGVVLVGLSPDSSNANLVQYLFGSLTTTSAGDLAVIAVLGVVVLLAMLLLRPALFAVCNDEEYAKVSGLPVRTLNLLMAVTTAVTVTIAMRTVGLLLVSALMVVPVAAAQQVTRGFRSTMSAAMVIGVVAAALGVGVSAEINTAPGATIVILALAVFLALSLGGALWRRTRTGPRRQVAAEPPDVVLQG
jgi:zinc transport system permease protein